MPPVSPEDLIKAGPSNPAEIKPVETEVPSGEDGTKAFDLDAFNTLTGREAEPPQEPVKETPSTPEPPKEITPEVPKEAPQPQPTKEITIPTAPTTARDYSGFTEQEQALLKQMSNPAFEYVVSRVKEFKKLQEDFKKQQETISKTDPVESNLLHEQAFVLDPDYGKSQRLMNDASNLANFFQQQIVKIKRGEKWIDLETDGQGNITQVEREPNDEAEEDLRARISENQVIVQQTREKLSNIAGNFKKLQSDRISAIKSVEDQYFPYFADEKVANENKYIQEMRTKLAENGLRNNILSNFLTKLYATTKRLQEIAMEQSEEIKKRDKLVEQSKAAGPTSGELEGKSPAKALSIEEKPFDYEAFERLKQY